MIIKSVALPVITKCLIKANRLSYQFGERHPVLSEQVKRFPSSSSLALAVGALALVPTTRGNELHHTLPPIFSSISISIFSASSIFFIMSGARGWFAKNIQSFKSSKEIVNWYLNLNKFKGEEEKILTSFERMEMIKKDRDLNYEEKGRKATFVLYETRAAIARMKSNGRQLYQVRQGFFRSLGTCYYLTTSYHQYLLNWAVAKQTFYESYNRYLSTRTSNAQRTFTLSRSSLGNWELLRNPQLVPNC